MALYEHTVIARPDLSAQQAQTLGETFTQLVKDQGGDVPKLEYWGLRNLAYRIKKNRKGHYVLLNIDAPAKAVQELERLQKINEDILRFMTIRVEALEEGPSAMMRKRDDDGERGDRRGPRGDRGDRPQGERRPRREEGANEGGF